MRASDMYYAGTYDLRLTASNVTTWVSVSDGHPCIVAVFVLQSP